MPMSPQPPGRRQIAPVCKACRSTRLTRTSVGTRNGALSVNVRCEACGHCWCSRSEAVVRALAPAEWRNGMEGGR